MEMDFLPYFKKYEQLVAQVDEAFARVQASHKDCVHCKIGCADCCYALFDLSLIEAIYINHQFRHVFQGQKRHAMIEKANRIDRQIYKVKRKAYKDWRSGKSEGDIFDEMGRERIRCPLLNDQDQCSLYEWRPITCRLYGIPLSIDGRSHTCGLSGFVSGEAYPTVNLDAVHQMLYDISAQLVQSLKTPYHKMADMLVPLSMALLTTYDAEYMGLEPEKPASEKEG